MTALTLISVVAFFVYLNLGLHILYTNHKSRLNRNFFYFCLSFAAASVVCAIFFSSIDQQVKEALSPYAPLPNLLFTFFILRFFLIFTGYYDNKKVRLVFFSIVWIIPVFLVYKSLFHNAIIRDYPYGNWMLYMIIQFLFCTTSLITVFIWWKRTRIPKEKKQGKVLFYFSLGTIVASTIVDYLTYDIYKYVSLGAVSSTVIWIFAVHYIVIKYRFMKLSPETVSLEIMNSIQDIIFLVDLNGKIIFVNNFAKKMLGECPATISDLTQKIMEDIPCSGLLDDLIGNEHDMKFFNVLFHTRRGPVPFDTTIKKLFTSKKELLGIIFIAQEVKGFEIFSRQYKLTKREEQIIFKILSGATNAAIAGILKVTERTVKAHVTNIYNKIGISNRIELYNLMKNYRIHADDKKESKERLILIKKAP